MSSFPQTLGIQNQRQAHALVKALVASKILSKWQTSGNTISEINTVLNSFANSVSGQCYSEQEINQYVHLVERMGYDRTKLAAETKIGTVYCMPIDAVAYRRINPKSKEHLTVFVSEGIKTDGTFSVCTITHTSLNSVNKLVIDSHDYSGINSVSYIPCDRKYQYNVSIDELFNRIHKKGKYANLPPKEQARMVVPYKANRLNRLLITLHQTGATETPLCISDGGVSYGIKQEISASRLPDILTNTSLFGLRYDHTDITERQNAIEVLETLYNRTGTAEKFIKEYKIYANLPLSYARYKIGIDTTDKNVKQCIEDLCVYLKAPKGQATDIIDYMTKSTIKLDAHMLLEYARNTAIPHAWDFFTLQVENRGIIPDLSSPHEHEKLRYLLSACPNGVDPSLYLKQFAGRDVILEYKLAKPITDPELLKSYGQFPTSEMSQIPLQNVITFLSYLKENKLAAQDVGQINSQMINNLLSPGQIAKERGIEEYLRFNTITDTNSLEHLKDISKHVSNTIDNGLDCILHKGDKLSTLMLPINPMGMGNFIDL